VEFDEDNPLLQEWSFSPEKGNIIFASALDCWGFGIAKFANIWSKKLGLNRGILLPSSLNTSFAVVVGIFVSHNVPAMSIINSNSIWSVK
jgi:hypothetical protein